MSEGSNMIEDIPQEILKSIRNRFHAVIRERVGDLVDTHGVELPELSQASVAGNEGWLDIPGMTGGFSYWFETGGDEAVLISESWSRVSSGSGQRHEITSECSRLVDEGFV